MSVNFTVKRIGDNLYDVVAGERYADGRAIAAQCEIYHGAHAMMLQTKWQRAVIQASLRIMLGPISLAKLTALQIGDVAVL